MKPTILFLFNSSTYAPDPWVRDGRFNCVSVDYDQTDHSGAHRIDDGHHRMNVDLREPQAIPIILERLELWGMAPPALVISFAPCTDLSVAGARHFAAKRHHDPHFQEKATRMAQLAGDFGCAYVVENPVSVLSTTWRKPDMRCDPCDFAGYLAEGEAVHPEFPNIIPAQDRYMKKTCLWYGAGFVPPRMDWRPPHTMVNPGWQKLGGKSARTKYIRSLTPRGMSRAIYEANYLILLNKEVDRAY